MCAPCMQTYPHVGQNARLSEPQIRIWDPGHGSFCSKLSRAIQVNYTSAIVFSQDGKQRPAPMTGLFRGLRSSRVTRVTRASSTRAGRPGKQMEQLQQLWLRVQQRWTWSTEFFEQDLIRAYAGLSIEWKFHYLKHQSVPACQ